MDERRKNIHKGIEEMIEVAMTEYDCDYKEARTLTLVALVGELVANIATLSVKIESLEKKLSDTKTVSSKITLN